MARIIGIISGKGGTGKTVVAINLAAALYRYYKKKVLVVDCNITTPHVGLYLGLYSTPITLNDALRGAEPVERAVYTELCGIDVIPASPKISDMQNLQWELVKEKIDAIADKYEFIFLDSSPGLNRESLITLSACHEALFVTNPLVYTVADLIKCRHACEDANIKQLGVVLNMVHNKKYEMKKTEVYNMINISTMFYIPYDDKVPTSIVEKRPVIEMSPRLAEKFRLIAKFIAEGEYEEKDSIISHIFPWLK